MRQSLLLRKPLRATMARSMAFSRSTAPSHCSARSAAYGIGPGDEVIVPPLTWYATAIAVRHVGATPVFVDILPDTLCIDPDKIEAAITERTKAIIPVHAYGSMADMDRIMAIARRHGLRVIEDCAHMHGGIWDGQGIGSLGDVGSFSFQHTKTMSSGEGGICITNDAEIAERIFRMKQIGYGFGELPRQAKSGPPPDLLCYNFRASAFQALILHEQLESLDSRLERYRKAVRYLEERLSASTKIRFQTPGSKAGRHGRFGWVMIFDDPAYADIPVESSKRRCKRKVCRSFAPKARSTGSFFSTLTRGVSHRSALHGHRARLLARLWLLHAYLGLDESQIEKIADAIEKVMSTVKLLKRDG